MCPLIFKGHLNDNNGAFTTNKEYPLILLIEAKYRIVKFYFLCMVFMLTFVIGTFLRKEQFFTCVNFYVSTYEID